MEVNCLDLKKKMPKELCWKAPNGRYYSSEDGYKAMCGRKATCQDTGKKLPVSMIFKAPNGKYYSCEEAYNAMRREVEWKNKCTGKMADILGYQPGMLLPTVWYKQLHEFEKYGFDVVYDTLVACEKNFEYALQHKQFKTDTNTLQYFKAIIQNNIMEQYKKKIAREKADLNAQINERNLEGVTSFDIGKKAVVNKNLSGLVGVV